MGKPIEIIDPEGDRQRRFERRVLIFFTFISLALFAYPEIKNLKPYFQGVRAARKLSLYLSMLKTRAILNKVAIEAKFIQPDRIDVYEVAHCGPNAHHKLLWTTKLADMVVDIQFAPEPWVRDQTDIKEPYLPRYCYDPSFGSSVFADGLVKGSIFIADSEAIRTGRPEHLVQISVLGITGDTEVE